MEIGCLGRLHGANLILTAIIGDTANARWNHSPLSLKIVDDSVLVTRFVPTHSRLMPTSVSTGTSKYSWVFISSCSPLTILDLIPELQYRIVDNITDWEVGFLYNPLELSYLRRHEAQVDVKFQWPYLIVGHKISLFATRNSCSDWWNIPEWHDDADARAPENLSENVSLPQSALKPLPCFHLSEISLYSSISWNVVNN